MTERDESAAATPPSPRGKRVLKQGEFFSSDTEPALASGSAPWEQRESPSIVEVTGAGAVRTPSGLPPIRAPLHAGAGSLPAPLAKMSSDEAVAVLRAYAFGGARPALVVEAAHVLKNDIRAQLMGAQAAIGLRLEADAGEFLARARLLPQRAHSFFREDLQRLGVALEKLKRQGRQPAKTSRTDRSRKQARSAAAKVRTADTTARPPRGGPAPLAKSAEAGPASPPSMAVALRFHPIAGDLGRPQALEPATRLFDYRLRLSALEVERMQSFEVLLALGHVHGVDRYDYQIRTVTRVLREFYGRVLLADEVGLGKTVEACLCLKEYLLRGLVLRVLILVPPALRAQWHDELENKFGIDAHVVEPEEARAHPEVWQRGGVLIASLGMARLEPHAAHIASFSFDLVIVDEAHRLKNRTTRSWQLVDRLRSRFLLLLSATPIENELVEIYNLLSLLKPGLFSTEAQFRRAFVGPGKGRTVKDPGGLRALLREVMIRNTRALTEAKLPPRLAATLRARPGAQEAELYEKIGSAVRDGLERGELARSSAGEILRAAGSSPAAAAALLASRLDPALSRLASAIESPAKDQLLRELLDGRRDEKLLLFAASRATLDHVFELVSKADRKPVLFHGGLSASAKEAAIAAFAADHDVLVSSESGGEGFNLQFARTVVNYDLPWNPMRIEQRIGRVHRIGQTREVFIFNLVTSGTVEEEILRVLDEKINMFELVVGEIDAILGRLGDDEQEFQELVLELYAGASDAGDLRRRFDLLGERMVAARGAYDRVKTIENAAFGRDLEA